METAPSRPRILCVDDEPRVLAALSRQLHQAYTVVTAESGAAGLTALADAAPVAVIVSDMRMPIMDGAAFLAEARRQAPDTVRILLTGQADLNDAATAVNKGGIFRFLQKPCPAEDLLAALRDGVRQFELVHAERVLLSETLHGSIKALTEILALANPAAFSRASRAKDLITGVLDALAVTERWPIEVAAMLSQIGAVILPAEVAERVYRGESLAPGDQAMVERMPKVVERLLASIPRLEPVREILRYQHKHFDGSGLPAEGPRGAALPLGARLLKIAVDFHVLEVQGLSAELAVGALVGRRGAYDEELLALFGRLVCEDQRVREIRELRLEDVRPGMTFVEDVISTNGLLIVAKGSVVSLALLERLHNFGKNRGVKEPVRVLLPRQEPAAIAPAVPVGEPQPTR
jgi:response regulator RpfG family c-di-GMP phosphodiesterase